jgi:hypothetical protein
LRDTNSPNPSLNFPASSWSRGGRRLAQADQLVEVDGSFLPFDGHPIHPATHDPIADPFVRRARHEDVRPIVLVGTFQPAGQVDAVAHDGVAEPLLRPDVADDHLPGIDPHPRLEGDVLPLLGQASVQAGDPRPALQGGAAGQKRVIGLRHGRIPEGHDGVADVFVDGRVILQEHARQLAEVLAEQRDEVFGIQPLRQRREPGDVREEDGDFFPLPAQFGLQADLHELTHQFGRHVLAEGAQAAFHLLELVDHVVDLDDIRRDVDAVLQVEGLDLGHLPGQQHEGPANLPLDDDPDRQDGEGHQQAQQEDVALVAPLVRDDPLGGDVQSQDAFDAAVGGIKRGIAG